MWMVIDALTRMVSDIVYTNSRTGPFQSVFKWFKDVSLGKFYYFTIVAVVIVGAFLIPLKQPLALLVLSGVLSRLTMAIYTPFLIYMRTIHGFQSH